MPKVRDTKALLTGAVAPSARLVAKRLFGNHWWANSSKPWNSGISIFFWATWIQESGAELALIRDRACCSYCSLLKTGFWGVRDTCLGLLVGRHRETGPCRSAFAMLQCNLVSAKKKGWTNILLHGDDALLTFTRVAEIPVWELHIPFCPEVRATNSFGAL